MESYKRCRKDIIVIKKNGAREYFSPLALIEAVNKSARRINLQLKKHQEEALVIKVEKAIRSCSSVEKKVSPRGVIILKTSYMHILVQKVLAEISPAIAIQYTSFRNYKTISPLIVENLKKRADEIIYSGDKENANKDSQLISTKKELLAGELSRSLIQFEISDEAKKAHEEGYYYEHDMSDKIYGSINCCLFDASNVLKGGFNLNGVKYTEPTSVESALRVIGDIILQASSQQYGGFTIPEIDSVVAPYIQKGLKASKEYYRKELPAIVKDEVVEELAYKYVVRALQQGFQAIETRLNTINNANGQTSFVAFTFALDKSEEGRLASSTLLDNRMLGIGQDHLTPVFPKLVFLHRYGINGKEEDRNYDLYLKSIKCISKRMYPDMLSLNKGYLGDIFDKYELAVSQMGCRAFLSPWYERGGMYPEDENDTPIFTGRANCGAITLNTVRYAIEAKGDKDKYYELLDKYFWIAIRRHLAIYDKMRKIKASSNPLFFCEGGCFLKLDPDESIERAIKTFTWSIGYIGLTEASLLMVGKELHEDNSFAIEVLEHLDKLIEEAKGKYKLLFAIYGTPAEGLCFKFRDKDFEKYGEIKGVTDKPYYMNSFHVNVNAPISSFEKQDIENPMFHLSKGGRISYVEFPNTGNLEALKVSMDKAMHDGKYEGTNIELDKCRDCSFDGEFKEHKCTRCGSSNIIEIGRVCGYLSYKVLDGDTRMNKGKVAEYEDRRDHFQIPVDVEEIYNELCTDIKR